jgi:hypothetical protein
MDDSAEQAPPSLLYAVKQVELAVRSHLDDLLRPAGITALQYTALTVLQRGHDVTAAQLARNSFVTTQSMSDLVTALERRKLISRARDTVDRRRITLSTTDVSCHCGPRRRAPAGPRPTVSSTRTSRRSRHARHR